MGYIPVCEHCGNDGLLWVVFDENENAVDVKKPFETRKKPGTKLAPCVCHKGYKQNPKAPYWWRKRNAEYGVRQILPDGTKGLMTMLGLIEKNWADPSASK